ncbi:phage terminase small subunit P27 family [Rhizobium mesoamericanum]|uniref:phage terminase small subunit P27 family n=1 Tax=Rhizobium mesoamericanum TaxID=1079800 RepID=UPI00138B0B73|nr:phage terminase small subunit P27 family [Rhizobium mesoamericanum]
MTALDGALRSVPPVPKGMPKRAASEWRKVLGVLVQDSKIADHELPIVEAYCRVVDHISECEAAIALHGMTFVSPTGELKRRPETMLLKEYHATLRQLANELGISPASRSKNKGGAAGNDDDDALGDI